MFSQQIARNSSRRLGQVVVRGRRSTSCQSGARRGYAGEAGTGSTQCRFFFFFGLMCYLTRNLGSGSLR
jgi:hypothetical protein